MSTKAETEQQPAAPALSAADTEPGTAESGGPDGLSSTSPPEAGGQESNRAVPENTQPKSEGSQNTTGKEHPPQTRVTTSDFNDSDGVAPPGYPLLIGTWNVQKMDEGKLERVKKEMERINVDILGVSELEWTGAGQFQSGSHMIYYSGYSTLKKSGVGFIIKKNVSKSLMRYKAVTDRLIVIRIQGKPVNTTIIHICAPATNVEDEEIDDFYKLLQSEIDQVSKKDALVITGDWNARVGDKEDLPVAGRFGLGERNEAGERMIEFCKTNDLYIGNTFYKRHKRRLYTYASPDGQYREQVAYLCGKRRWRCLMSSIKTRPGAICGTDHRLLMCRFGLMLKKSRPNPEGPKHGPDRIPPELTPSQ